MCLSGLQESVHYKIFVIPSSFEVQSNGNFLFNEFYTSCIDAELNGRLHKSGFLKCFKLIKLFMGCLNDLISSVNTGKLVFMRKKINSSHFLVNRYCQQLTRIQEI